MPVCAQNVKVVSKFWWHFFAASRMCKIGFWRTAGFLSGLWERSSLSGTASPHRKAVLGMKKNYENKCATGINLVSFSARICTCTYNWSWDEQSHPLPFARPSIFLCRCATSQTLEFPGVATTTALTTMSGGSEHYRVFSYTIQQTSSKLPANVFIKHMNCWTFAGRFLHGSCKHPIINVEVK